MTTDLESRGRWVSTVRMAGETFGAHVTVTIAVSPGELTHGMASRVAEDIADAVAAAPLAQHVRWETFHVDESSVAEPAEFVPPSEATI